MRRTLTSLVLAGVLWAGLGPLASMAEEPLVQEAPTAITTIPGFGSFISVSGLTDPRGAMFGPQLNGFPNVFFVVEKSLNRVSVAPPGGTPTPFATGLATPVDLAAPRNGGTPFGNFLYVAESSANRISRISNTGAVTPFASLPAAPKRLAFSDVAGGSAFGDLLFVTLANGEVRKIDATGTVLPCASGFTSPTGLVFGPGGSSRTTVLYVADSTANTISKVDTTCAVSSFASTGLTAPTGLAISPFFRLGPLDTTLYVVNAAGTRIDRVDKSGNVTPFASGFTQADTDNFNSAMPQHDSLFVGLNVTDAIAGTIVIVGLLRPVVSLQLSGCNPCQAGQTFAITLTARNDGPIGATVEVKSGFRLLDATSLVYAPLIGNSKHFEVTLPSGFNQSFLWVSLTWPTVPAGRYCYEATLLDPDLDFLGPYSIAEVCFVSLP